MIAYHSEEAPMTDRLTEIMEILDGHISVAVPVGTEYANIRGLDHAARAIMALDGWRDIATAPSGNAEFDVWASGKRIANCHRHHDEILQWASDSVDDEPHWRRVEGATHWRPLPPAPESQP